ncbi:MAG TPA: hypothetical protein ENJ06_04695 [Phycisphaeraceae bacterium]|nr:hypothetical protein [Phycisphaeraceae bacterium]
MRIGPIAGCGLAAAALSALPAAALAVPTVDGMNIPADFGTAASVQRFQTNFGDDTSGDQFGNGSELDQLFITNDADNLYLGITGNLQNNGNCIVIFIDVDNGASGSSLLFTKNIFGGGETLPGLPRYFAGDDFGGVGFNDVTFDNGFAPNFALGMSGGSPLGSQTLTYYLVNWTELGDSVPGVTPDSLDHVNTVNGLMVAGDADAHGSNGQLSTFWPGSDTLGIKGAADNSNTAGVDGGNGLWTVDPATATKGVEYSIPLSLLGVAPGDDVCVFALVSGDSGWISNQLLPTDDVSTTFDNLGNDRPLDFNAIAGTQAVCYTIQQGSACAGDLDGDGDTDQSDLGVLLAAYLLNGNGDLDGDGDTDQSDLGILLADYLCGT